MKNFVQRGVEIDYVNDDLSAAIASGDVVVLPNGIGIATVDIADGDTGAVLLEGVVSKAKATGETWEQGDKIFWDDSAKKFTKTATGHKLAGLAFQDALTGDTVGYVKLAYLGEKDNSGVLSQAVFVAQIATADGSDAGTTQTLANANKAKVNALLTALINAGLMASS